MANICDTQYKVTGSRKAVADLWNTLQELEVNSNNVYLYLLAEHYGIDYEKKGISVRGHIYWAEYEENDFFPEECYVTAYGELFEDCEGAYSTFGDAIKLWCEKTGVSQDGRSEQKMIDFINEYEYEAEDTNFCINPITFG